MMNSKAPSACTPPLPALPLLSELILTSHLRAARTDRIHTQTLSLPVGTLWRTSWKADGSPVLSGQPPDGKHTDLQKPVPVVSQLQQAWRASCCLILTPGPIRTLPFYIYSLQGIPVLLPLCAFLSLSQLLQLLLYNNLVFFPMSKAVWDGFFSSSQVSVPLENSWHKHSFVVPEWAAPQISIWDLFARI